MPIDKEAPKGRIKQLQVQAIRDLLDGDASCLVVKDGGLKSALKSLGQAAEHRGGGQMRRHLVPWLRQRQ